MSIRAGAAARDITPKESVRLAAFTGSTRMSTGVRDPLYASAVHLRGGSGGIIVVSLDLLSLEPRYVHRIRNQIVEATGTRGRNILIGTTQTHSGPVTNRALFRLRDGSYTEPAEEYLAFVADQAVQAASEAAVASVPAGVATVSLGKPHTGAVLVRDNRSSRIIAAIIVNDEVADYLGLTNTEISSDLVHIVREKLAARFGGEPVVAYFAGSSGHHRLRETVKGASEETPEHAGKRLADAIVFKVKSMKQSDFCSEMGFSGALGEVHDVPRIQLPSRYEATISWGEATKIYEMLRQSEASQYLLAEAKWAVVESECALGLIVAQQNGLLAEVMSDYEPTEVQAVRIGPLKLLCLPFSLFAECAETILSGPDDNTWIVECVNGDMQGSILAANSGSGGGYRLMSALFAPDAGNMLVDSALALAKQQ